MSESECCMTCVRLRCIGMECMMALHEWRLDHNFCIERSCLALA
jgi:hypothetical protein